MRTFQSQRPCHSAECIPTIRNWRPDPASDSGNVRGKRMVWGGRTQVRATLYLATLSASRFNPAIKPFYQRLLVQGKQPKVALTACMRKLLIILNTIVTTQIAWNPNHFSTLDFNHGR